MFSFQRATHKSSDGNTNLSYEEIKQIIKSDTVSTKNLASKEFTQFISDQYAQEAVAARHKVSVG